MLENLQKNRPTKEKRIVHTYNKRTGQYIGASNSSSLNFWRAFGNN